MVKLVKPPLLQIADTKVLDLLPPIMLLPDEDENAFKELHQSFMISFAPTTPYQTAVASNLVNLEWEILRHRNTRDNIVRRRYREFYAAALITSDTRPLPHTKELNSQEVQLVSYLFGKDPTKRSNALQSLKKWKIDLQDIQAETYKWAASEIEIHERRLAELEIRRRRLREEFDSLKSTQSKDVEDAEVVAIK